MGFEDWIKTDVSSVSTPLTAEALREAAEKVAQQDKQHFQLAMGRYEQFMDAVPEHLRKHKLVAEMATIILEGIILHPADAQRYKERYFDLLASDVPNTSEGE